MTDLPPSVTVYDSAAIEPIRGCCTTFSAMPDVSWTADDRWQRYVDSSSANGGYLTAAWNAHPAGSLIVADDNLAVGFTIVDLP